MSSSGALLRRRLCGNMELGALYNGAFWKDFRSAAPSWPHCRSEARGRLLSVSMYRQPSLLRTSRPLHIIRSHSAALTGPAEGYELASQEQIAEVEEEVCANGKDLVVKATSRNRHLKKRGRPAAISEVPPSEADCSEPSSETQIPKAACSDAAETTDMGNVAFIAFDIETTGFRASEDRIIEFAARDLAGGERSTVSALVNPGRQVPYYISAITGITNSMVNQPHIPSWKEVGPVIVEFVESRRQGNGPVVLVAHNGKRFDVPFLLKEFQQCSIDVPDWWRFLDSMPLAREAKKKRRYKWPSLKLSDIHECYGLQSPGRAHRAMADVHMLASVLGLVVQDLNMELTDVLQRTFTAEEIISSSKLFHDQSGKEVLEADLPPEEVLSEAFEEPWEPESLADIQNEIFDSDEAITSFSSLDGSSAQMDPALKHYVELKRKLPDSVHLVKSGDFYEAFFEDAEILAGTCKVRLFSTENVKMSRLPASKFHLYAPLLLGKSLQIVVQNQLGSEDAQEISAVLTPGMVLSDGLHDPSQNTFLACVMPSETSDSCGLAYCDLVTGEVFATQSEDRKLVLQNLKCIEPAELIVPLEGVAIDLPFCAMRPSAECTFLTKDNDLSLQYEHLVPALEERPLADCAVGGLLRYVQRTQGSNFTNWLNRKPYLIFLEDYLAIGDCSEVYLELIKGRRGKSLFRTMDATKTTSGSRMLFRWISHPLVRVEDIQKRLDAVEVLIHSSGLRKALRQHLSNVMDIDRLAGNVLRKLPSQWEDLFELAQSLCTIPKIFCILEQLPRNPYFSNVLKTPPVVIEFAEEIQRLLVADGGREEHDLVKDWVDESLDSLRAEIRNCDESMQKLQASSLEGTNVNKSHTELEYFEYERKKEEASLKASEREQELLEAPRRKMMSLLESFQEANHALASLDVICSFAELAASRNYCRPELLSESNELAVIAGRHPISDFDKDFASNTYYIGNSSATSEATSQKALVKANLLVVTGSKGSGKSCLLQQIALIQVLAQCGSFVPAVEARLSVADAIFTFQDAPAAAEALRRATLKSLVLIDDFKPPAESQTVEVAISKAMIEYLGKHIRSKAVFCTEDYDLNVQDELPFIANYHMSELHLRPGGVPREDRVNGIAEARKSGLPEWVCNRSRELAALEAGSTLKKHEGGTYNFWNRIMNFTKVKTPNRDTKISKKSSNSKASSSSASKADDLHALWQQVSVLLEDTPATLALAKQKGSLLSISKATKHAVVTIGTAPLFVRKFKQQEHAAALEAAFYSVLNQPVEIRVLDECEDKCN